MTINDETLAKDIWDEIRSKLVGNVFITNSSTAETTQATIAAQYNDQKTSRPQVIIQNLADAEDGWKFGSKEGKKAIDVFIDCYAPSTLGTAQMKGQVCSILKEDDIEGIELIGVESNAAFINPNELKYHIYNITFTYNRE